MQASVFPVSSEGPPRHTRGCGEFIPTRILTGHTEYVKSVKNNSYKERERDMIKKTTPKSLARF
jgi:hypothetical protein